MNIMLRIKQYVLKKRYEYLPLRFIFFDNNNSKMYFVVSSYFTMLKNL